ncbi:sugar-specific transcriptional regulator TrmB [Methanospirillum lacunae]|uniref:Sugar-specific transcriptional regulator TrmB n=1 Tax=Methanospirillum lacunae TaxID=668570 RepID=A0A2V2MP10_9EURY|nr:sugar-specific transcriptional regulator TrmB [Methanospirillum lacunae]PWR69954.1 sugar-specific transcriptional regulator TrmB [Methanospirillum lacunae]
MQGVIERRRTYLQLMRRLTLEKGFFTVQEIQQETGVPRSTVQDWVLRLSEEGCVVVLQPPRGRTPAQYAATSALPKSACKRIFTSVDGDLVEIVHECMSSACAGFCGYHHELGSKNRISIVRDGTLLREFIHLGENEATVGLYPHSAVAVTGVYLENDQVIQRIKSVGGPAFSLSGMMGLARGVLGVETSKDGSCTKGIIRTKALSHLTIGIDDTDSQGGGATFALAIALLQHLGGFSGVFPITHHVMMLFPDVRRKTAGNSCSAIELAVDSGMVEQILSETIRFVSDESVSPSWGVAIRSGLKINDKLRLFGLTARREVVSYSTAKSIAESFSVMLSGGEGIIGALAAVALVGLPAELLLDPGRDPTSLPGSFDNYSDG